jgi:hypothetical protein
MYWPETVEFGSILLFKFAAIIFAVFPFPIKAAQLIDKFWKNRSSGTSAQIVLAQ